MHRLETPKGDPHLCLRARMQELGIPAWRLSADGRVLDTPPAQGVRATWLSNRSLIERLESAARGVAPAGAGARVVLWEGCEVVFVPAHARRRVVEWTAGMFLTSAGLETPEFAEGCRRAQVDTLAALKAIGPLAGFTEAETGRFAKLLP